jgi:secreted Zn-dependent insulinase-like peptidase
LQVSGFNHKLPALTKTIFQTFRKLQVDNAAFDRVKEVFSRRLRNAHMKPEKAAGYYRLYGLRKDMWHTDAELAALETTTAADVQVSLSSLSTI